MPVEPTGAGGFDVGALSPVSAGADGRVSDDAFITAMLGAEIALVRALDVLGLPPDGTADAILTAAETVRFVPSELARAAVEQGQPAAAVLKALRDAIPEAGHAEWVHKGVASQDIIDTAIAMIAASAISAIRSDLQKAVKGLARLANDHRGTITIARTVTQHALPMTYGARFADWLVQIADARDQLSWSIPPAQLGGSAGNLAALVEEFGPDTAFKIIGEFANQTGLTAPNVPWQVRRSPITRLGDGLVTVVDALGRMAGDILNLTRTEVGELHEGREAKSGTMPHKRNPVHSVLIKSAALRAPNLAAQLHLDAALAVDERPDGSWHAEWPTVRELLRLTLGAASHAADLVADLRVDRPQIDRNLVLAGDVIMSERLMLSLGPFLGRDEVQALVDQAARGQALSVHLANEPALHGFDVRPILDPTGFLGISDILVNRALARVEEP